MLEMVTADTAGILKRALSGFELAEHMHQQLLAVSSASRSPLYVRPSNVVIRL